ncbi:LCP family protein [Luteipulveratus sp. YIM 133132]|uniref:LCP family protein n=1 Tax=Luteipulveratus flavus TaxID=3031728 RepID=UPI0023B1C47C|nr:LCP family protein [Luteipulveratus sp. YIM 133132]MDE9364676.1 LCP family protein [Luteipulveratus sp. YIM 133132]
MTNGAYEALRRQPRDGSERADESDSGQLLTRSQMRGRRTHEVRRALGLTALSTVFPGLGLIFTRRHRFGFVLLAGAALSALVMAYFVANGGILTAATQLLSKKGLLALLAAFLVGGILWVFGIMLTARETSRRGWGAKARWLQRVFTLVMCLVVAVPAARATQYVLITQDTFGSMFQDRFTGRGHDVAGPGGGANPWKDVPRVNILLLGSDAGLDRVGVRTDSMMVVSIDTRTGDSVLISIPRNLQKVPFPEDNPLHEVWPDGFDCGIDCQMDAVWQQAASDHKDLYPADEKYPGWNTTREVIEEVVGLQMNYSVVINLQGFQQLVDAMGGVTMTVPEGPSGKGIAIGGVIKNGHIVKGSITGYVEPGTRKLTGREALWYSRSRAEDPTGDNGRMKRQQCMVNALVDQTNPAQMLAKFPAIMQVAKKNILLDVPQDDLSAFSELVTKMKKGHMRSVHLGTPVINTAKPNFTKIRSLVDQAINPPAPAASTETAPPTAGSTDGATPGATDGATPGETPTDETSSEPTGSSSSSTNGAISSTAGSC